MSGDVGLKARELIRQTCQMFEIDILKGGRQFVARGYFCVTLGELTQTMIEEHLEHLEHLEHHFEPKAEDNF